MKAPKPVKPANSPAGTIWSGGPIEWDRVTFRTMGDKLDPDEITGRDGTVARLTRTGIWRLDLNRDETDEWDCGEAIVLFAA